MSEPELIRYKGTVKLGSTPGWGTEYWTEEDWENHRKYIKELKASGDYGKEVEVTIDMVPIPSFDNYDVGVDVAKGESTSAVMLDVSNLNKHIFYFMENILDKVTEEQLEVSKKLGEIRDTLKRWSKMTNDTQEKATLIDLSERVSDAEQDYDNWMLELNNE